MRADRTAREMQSLFTMLGMAEKQKGTWPRPGDGEVMVPPRPRWGRPLYPVGALEPCGQLHTLCRVSSASGQTRLADYHDANACNPIGLRSPIGMPDNWKDFGHAGRPTQGYINLYPLVQLRDTAPSSTPRNGPKYL